MKKWRLYYSSLFRAEETIGLVADIGNLPTVTTLERILELRSPPEFQFVVANPLAEASTSAKMTDIISYRNFVIEFDGITRARQRGIIKKYTVPYSAIVFSGSKSLHFIICLEGAITALEYAEAATYLKQILPAADVKCFNPNRLTRAPGARRPSTDKVQTCVEARAPIPNDIFFNWLWSRARPIISIGTEAPIANTPEDTARIVQAILRKTGLSRHDQLLKIGVALSKSGSGGGELLSKLEEYANIIGIGDRPDAMKIYSWLESRR